jgi:hypothetical protein
MNEEKKNKKPYEPPRIYDIAMDLHQAMGQSNCNPGSGANQCSNGTSPTNAQPCPNGNMNANGCANGTGGA